MNLYAREWLHEVAVIAEAFNDDAIGRMAGALIQLRADRGRLFVCGVGGSAANASHAVADFRRISGIQAYAPADNVAEFSALTNDLGWHTTFERWLAESQLEMRDAVLILSVNGGTPQTSPNLVAAVRYAQEQRATVLAIVGRYDGYAARHADVWIGVPCPNEQRRTYHAESFQSVLCHLLANQIAEGE